MEHDCCATLVRRLEQKYLGGDDDDAEFNQILFTAFTGFSPCKMASQRALELLVLNNMNITTIGDAEKLAHHAAHVLEADLSRNQISQWEDVACILDNLPNLKVLNIGHNPLKQTIDFEIPRVSALNTLILSGTQLQFDALQSLMKAVPNLVELHLSDNKFDENDSDLVISDTVTTLHLTRCGFIEWKSAMNVIKRFPSVGAVFLCENPLRNVEHNELFDKMTSWSFINLSKTQIDDWKSIDELNKMKSIVELRIPNIPLVEQLTVDERMHLIIGRVHQLRVLNGSLITSEHREQSERFFIRYYQDRDDKPPAYKPLVDKHGQLEKLPNIDLTPKSKAIVRVHCEENEYNEELSICLNKTVLDFMKQLDPRCGVRYTRMKLFLFRGDGRCEDFTSSTYNMQLHSFRLDDGDVFMIQSKMVVPKRRRPMSTTSSSS